MIGVMDLISRENVCEIFLRICDEENAVDHGEMIDRSIAKVEGALTVETLTAAQKASCEYAAACEAVYEYALEAASAQRLAISERGEARCGKGELITAEAADRLRKHAYGELSGIARLGGFVFETMEGLA